MVRPRICALWSRFLPCSRGPNRSTDLVERLEVHYLANPDGELHFALVSDWNDAEGPELPDDAELLAAASAGVARLNQRHGPGPGGADRFLLFHRRRLFNPGEDRHMGWERKRGKLHELNRLLRGAVDTTFIETEHELPERVRYVIALDADSRLPPGAATRLVATIAHPLNRARVDDPLGWVVEGYGVLQPRVTAFLGAGGTSFFQRVFFPPAGIDPYAAAVSDVYQDLFGVGSYAGKGIYEIDTFEAALAGRIPENSLLSHDLFEGSFARAGLVSNVEVFEEFPSHYEVALSRQHRWVRGDWQLLPWILGRHGPLPPVARLKMVDNLRRSLSGPAVLITLIASFLIPGCPGLDLDRIHPPLHGPPGSAASPRTHDPAPYRPRPGPCGLRRWGSDVARAAGRLLLQAAFVAHQALRLTDAIVVTLWRLAVSRRGMLNWVTAEDAERQFGLDQGAFIRRMGPSMVTGLASTVGSPVVKPEAFVAALGWSAMWVAGSVHRLPSQHPPPGQAGRPAHRRGARGTAPHRPAHLAVLRTLRHQRTQLVATGQLPGGPGRSRSPNLSHQHRPLFAVGSLGPRVRVDRNRRATSRLEATDRHPRPPRAIRRPFPQLVRHHLPSTSAPPIRVDGRQRQPGGTSARRLPRLRSACKLFEPGPEVAAGIRDEVMLDPGSRRPPGREPRDRSRLAPRTRDFPGRSPRLARQQGHSWESDRLSELLLAMPRPWPTSPRPWQRPSGAGELAFWAEALVSHACEDISATSSFWPMLPPEGFSPSAWLPWPHGPPTSTEAMDFSFLMDPDNKLLAIGYRPGDTALDTSHYDLLASEARLASFVGIAKGELPPSHWFRLGRSMTPMGADAALISWSGSMFEYLMPLLVMRSPPESILDTTYRAVVRRQIEYGNDRQVPVGDLRGCLLRPATSGSSTSTRHSGFRGSGSSEASAKIWWSLPTPPCWRRWSSRAWPSRTWPG